MDQPPSESPKGTPLDGKFSCQACHKRKVRCDRKQPCSTCQKGQVDCIYLAPAPPRRRKRLADKDILARLRRYEDQLKKAGLNVEDEDPGSPSESAALDDVRRVGDNGPPSDVDNDSKPAQLEHHDYGINMSQQGANYPSKIGHGRLISDKSGKSRYLENNLWVTLDDEIHDPEQMIQDQGKDQLQSDEDTGNDTDVGYLLLGNPTSDRDLRRQYPPPEVADLLWQTYVQNVNPIVKIIHMPSFQKLLDVAKKDLTKVSKSQLALLYSVFHFAVVSVDQESFERLFTQNRGFLMKRFRALTQQALINASFLKSSDIVTLQAYVNYLLAIRSFLDSQTIWALSGVAFRIARRMGLHRDGETHGLPPFEVEMRRRLWLQLMILDHTSAELAGSAPTFWTMMSDYWDAKRPLNINDADIDPSTTEFPPERVGATEMILCLMRYEFGHFFREQRQKMTLKDGFDGKWATIGAGLSIADKDKLIDKLQHRLEHNYVRYCDPIDPLHYMCMIAARSAVAGMRLRSRHPRQYSDNGASMSQEEKDLLFDLGIKVTQYDNLAHSTPALKGFLWHIKLFLQWNALIFLLSELRFRRMGDDAERGWKEVADTYKHHPEIVDNRRYVLHAAVMSLTLKAWDCREAESRKQGVQLEVPAFIQHLRTLQRSSKLSANRPDTVAAVSRQGLPGQQQHASPDAQGTGATWWTGIMDANTSTSSSSVGEPTPIDWTQWDTLMQVGDTYENFFDFELYPDYTGVKQTPLV